MAKEKAGVKKIIMDYTEILLDSEYYPKNIDDYAENIVNEAAAEIDELSEANCVKQPPGNITVALASMAILIRKRSHQLHDNVPLVVAFSNAVAAFEGHFEYLSKRFDYGDGDFLLSDLARRVFREICQPHLQEAPDVSAFLSSAHRQVESGFRSDHAEHVFDLSDFSDLK